LKPYKLTLADLRTSCPLLATIEVAGEDSKSEQLVGRNALGEVVVRAKGKVTPAKIQQFRNAYQHAVSAGIIKPKPEEEPHA
jgi:hypothetical protein